MGHVILLGDSIFDNARYVPDRPPVIEQVRMSLPAGWKATLLARDGHVTSDVPAQLSGLREPSHLFLSVGGNDALGDGIGDGLGHGILRRTEHQPNLVHVLDRDLGDHDRGRLGDQVGLEHGEQVCVTL